MYNYLCYWKRYVYDTYPYVVREKNDFVLKELSSYHPNIKFACELEENNKTTFLDVFINRMSINEIKISFSRKKSNTEIEMLLSICNHLHYHSGKLEYYEISPLEQKTSVQHKIV